MADKSQGIGTRTLRGMFWAYGSYVGGRALVLVATALLARILSPKEFGLVAAALVVTALLERLADLGLGQALVVQEDSVVYERADTAFVVSVGIGATLSALVAVLSPLAAGFFGQQSLGPLLSLLGLNFLLRSLTSVHYSLAQRALDFRARTAAELADVLVRGAASIGLALAGAGAYSLVVGYLVGNVALLITLWVMVPWRPKLRARRSDLPDLMRFGGGISVFAVIVAAMSNVDYVFVGRVLGPVSLGLYTLGFRLPELLIANLAIVAGEVLFPAMASVERESMARAFQTSLRYTLILALPIAAALAILAEPAIITLFGPQWHGSVAAMQVLTAYSFAIALGIPAGTAYKATGRVDVLLKLAFPRLLVAVAALALFVDKGIVAAAACQAGVAGSFEILGLLIASRLLDSPVRALVRIAVGPIAATALMSAAILGVTVVVKPLLAQLLVGASVGAVVYLGLLWLLMPEAVRRLRSQAFPRRWPSDDDIMTTHETDVIA